MEIFELRYFLSVAQFENIHRASTQLSISPGSLSKAVSRLEDELGVALFVRDGRNIVLTDHGRLLQKRASELIQMEEATRLQISGHLGTIRCVLIGSEIVISEIGLGVIENLEQKFPKIEFELQYANDQVALQKIEQGEAHLAIVTSEVPEGLAAKTLGSSTFQTCVGRKHPLYAAAKAKKPVAIEKVLEHAFVNPSYGFLGQVGNKQSFDGWRDDKFPRRIRYVTSCLKMIEQLVVSGKALAYLPDYYVKSIDAEVLDIHGCPYSCSQKIRMVARNPKQVGWLNQLF